VYCSILCFIRQIVVVFTIASTVHVLLYKQHINVLYRKVIDTYNKIRLVEY